MTTFLLAAAAEPHLLCALDVATSLASSDQHTVVHSSTRAIALRGGALAKRVDREKNDATLRQRVAATLRNRPPQWYARALLFWLTARVPFYSIAWDEWDAVRSSSTQASTATSIAEEIMRRRRRGARVQKLIGVGYTPRIVALAGLMLRSLHVSTSLPAVWDPPLGLGAGECLAAKWTQREWLACLMVGWYAGGAYWRTMGVAPPADFGGVPVAVRRVRI
jgi:hypothetical protein